MTDANDDPIARFAAERTARALAYPGNAAFGQVSADWTRHAFAEHYMYNWSWMGRPAIQLPADIMAMTEIIWAVKPDLIIETGIAHGGSLVMSASMLALIDMAEALERGETLDPSQPSRRVVAVDIDIRAHNREAIEAHPMANRILMIEGSSLDPTVIAKVAAAVGGARRVLISLDSNHTHDHVLGELRAYAPFTSKGSYCVVFDTIIEDLPKDFFPDRPWNPGDSPRTAIAAFRQECEAQDLKGMDGAPLRLEVDPEIDGKLVLTAAPGGFLRRV